MAAEAARAGTGRALGVVLVGLAAGFALATGLGPEPLPEVSHLRDDAYYGFTWVRSLVEGRGPVVSEGLRTSGVHPLWCLILAGPAALFGAASLPAVAQVLGVLLHAGTAALLWAGPGRCSRGGLLAGLLFLGNPVLIAEAQNGQETALTCLLVLVLWQLRRGGGPAFLAAGAALVLARSDLLPLVACLALLRGWRGGLLAVAAAGPLLLFNLWAGGGWVQDSGWPIPWLFRANFLAGDPGLGEHLDRLWWFLRPCLLGGPFAVVSPWWSAVFVFVILRRRWPRRWRWLPLVATAGAWLGGAADLEVPAAAAVLLALSPAGSGSRPGPRDLVALGAGLWLLVLVHEVVRNYPRNYYFVPIAVAGGIALVRVLRGRGFWWAVPLALLQAFAARGPVTEQRGWQEEMSMAGRTLDRVLPADELVGCFNGGLVTFYRPDRTVNLDGRVNPEAFAALRAHRLSEYLDRAGVRFVLDTPVQFARRDAWPHASGRYFGADFDPVRDLREIARFDIAGVGGGIPGTDSFRLYWRVGAGPAPPPATGIADLGPAPGGGRFVRWAGETGATLAVAPPGPDRERRVVARGHTGVAIVLTVRPAWAGPALLYESGREAPVLVLEPL